MAKRKSADWPVTITSQSGSAGEAGPTGGDGIPATKTAAIRKYLTEHPEAQSYSDIIAGVKANYNYDVKTGDVSNAKTYLAKAGSNGLRKVPRKKKRGSMKLARRKATVITSATAAAPPAASDVVSATLDLVAAVGLDQARAIIAGLGK